MISGAVRHESRSFRLHIAARSAIYRRRLADFRVARNIPQCHRAWQPRSPGAGTVLRNRHAKVTTRAVLNVPDLVRPAPSDQSVDAPRRTFAIISHPDAGTTTLTEK